MHIRATSQPSVFQDLESGDFFEHDGKNPLSQKLGLLQQAGAIVRIEAYIPPSYSDHRRACYQQITRSDVDEAILEYLLEGRSEKLEAMKARRLEIKSRFPKS
jgi:hypothetical protein